MQATLACLTRLVQRGMHCIRVVTHPRSRWNVWDWGPRSARWVLVAEPIVLGWVAVETVRAILAGIGSPDWIRLGLLLLAAALYLLGTNVAEERRRGQHVGGNHVDHTSLIFFAAALLLPVPLTVVLISLVRIQRWRVARKPIYKFFHTTVAIMFSALGVHLVAELTPLQAWMSGTQDLTSPQLKAAAGVALLGAAGAYFFAQLVMVGAVRGFASEIGYTPKPERAKGWQRQLRVEMFGTTWDNFEIIGTLLLAIGFPVLAVAVWLPLLLVVVPIGIFISVILQLLDELRHAASTDSKTGLLTVRTFNARAGKVLARAARSGRPTSLLVLDLDHFKRINDTFGHHAGDAVLKAVARLLQHIARAGDEVCRHGGEEMVILLPETDLPDALRAAERIRADVEALTVDVTKAAGGDLYVIAVTVSIGVATIPTHGADLDTVTQRADDALYAAKSGGRNQVHAAVMARASTPIQHAD